jgi:hypothetical protein
MANRRNRSTTEPAATPLPAKKAKVSRSVVGHFLSRLKRIWVWLQAGCLPPRDPVLRSLRLVKRYGGSSIVPERQWLLLEQQARTMAKSGQSEQAIMVLHCLMLLKPGSADVRTQLEKLTASHHKLLLNFQGISDSTRAYRKQQLNFYMQQWSVRALEAVSQL